MLKTILGSIALLLLVDGMAFGGYYREQVFMETMQVSHNFFSLDWKGFLR